MVMNKRIFAIILPVILLFCLDGKAVAQKNDEAVPDILAKYDTAWNKKDSATVGNILEPGYIYFSSTGGITTRERTLEFLNSPKYVLTSAQRSEVKTYRTGDTVIVSSRWIGKGTYDTEVIDDDQRCGLVFTKLGNNGN
jgi:hypothetical protein